MESAEERTQDEKYPRMALKKRLVLHDKEEDVTVRPAEKGKTMPTKPQSTVEPEPEPEPEPVSHPTKNIEKSKNPKASESCQILCSVCH